MASGIVFRLRDVGPIAEARVEVDGITVVSGPNSCGKSTVLKTAYAVLEPSAELPRTEEGAGYGIESLHLTALRSSIEGEFGTLDQFVRSDGPGDARVSVDCGGVVRGLRATGREVSWSGPFLDLPRPVFLDSSPSFALPECGHARRLRDALTSEGRTGPGRTPSGLDAILSEAVPGRFSCDRGTPTYTDPSGAAKGMLNAGSGTWLFGALRILADSGRIGEGTVLTLDRPEASLHPLWINVLARAVCALCADTGARVLMSTTSPQLLMAVEGLTRDAGVPANHYLMSREDGAAVAEDVSDDPQPIYMDMARAVNEASDMFWRDDDDERRGASARTHQRGRDGGAHVRGAVPDSGTDRRRVRDPPRVALRLQGPRGQPPGQRLRLPREGPEGHGNVQDGRVLRPAGGGPRRGGGRRVRGVPPR